MAPKPAMNALLVTLTLFSGCLSDGPSGDGSADPPAGDTDAQDEAPSPSSPPPAPAPTPSPGCKGTGNHGIHIGLGDHYVQSRDGAAFARVYKESNGLSGLQTVDGCPENPDEVLAEVPDVPPQGAPSSGDCPRFENSSVYLHIGDRFYVAGPYGPDALIVYEESNGVRFLQVEHDCANPDTKVAAVPFPASPASLNL